MLKSITVTNYIGESLLLQMGSSVGSGLLITHIEGLGPTNATVNVSDISTMDGGLFNSARISSRNIVLTLRMDFAPTIEDARLTTYRYFPVKKMLTLKIETDNRLVDITGYVESNEPTIFSSAEETQISIICPDPYFYSSGDGESYVFSGVEPQFEFPFCNDSVTEDLLLMSQIKTESSGTIYYDGDSDVGVSITIQLLGVVGDITIYNPDTREVMAIDISKISTAIGGSVQAGDCILISTVKGKKFAQLLRDGLYTNILNSLDKTSDWFQLIKGKNTFIYTADSGEDDLEFKIDYRLAYEGV